MKRSDGQLRLRALDCTSARLLRPTAPMGDDHTVVFKPGASQPAIPPPCHVEDENNSLSVRR